MVIIIMLINFSVLGCLSIVVILIFISFVVVIVVTIMIASFGVVMPHTVVLPEERARLQAEVHPLI